MRNFNRSNFGGNRGNDRFQRNNDRQMHEATCSNCGDACQVPFRPSGDKPIYCNTCFAENNSGNSRPSFGQNNYSRPQRSFSPSNRTSSAPPAQSYKKDLELISQKLDQLISAVNSLKVDNSPEPKSKPKATKAKSAPKKKSTPKA